MLRFGEAGEQKMAERYKIEGEVGKGGEGFVYNAYDKVLKRTVALKRVLTKDRGTAEEVERAADALVAEAQTLSALNHPNIVTVFDVGKDEDGGFVVMELIKGETLDEVVARGAFTKDDFYRFARQTMEALMAAQEINVVHRDLKPGNVMMIWHPGGRFQAKILDFGLAKFSEVPSLQTLDFAGSVKGSIYFMAPEQFERAELDERTDLYAMGCVYYFALTGKYPFDGETSTMVMVSHLQHQVVSLEKVRQDLPPELCQWVMWLINRDIETRPKDAEMALKNFPQNMSANEISGLQNLPVNQSKSGRTTGVQVVLPTHSVAAPTGMVLSSEDEASSSNVEPFDQEKYDLEYPSEKLKKKRGCPFTLVAGVFALAVVGYFVWPMFNEKSDEEKKAAPAPVFEAGSVANKSQLLRLEELLRMENPQGTAADVDMVLNFLNSKDESESRKNKAQQLLVVLQGEGVEEALLSRLKRSRKSLERISLSIVVAERNMEQSVLALLLALDAEKNDLASVKIVHAIQLLLTVEDAHAVIERLKKNYSSEVREGLEQAVASAFRRLPASRKNLRPLLEGLERASGKDRASLWRILGMRGGDLVVQKLEQVFLREKHDVAYLLDAMEALKLVPTPKVVNLLNNIYSMTGDGDLKIAAAEALAHAVVLPSNDQMDVRRFWWQLALKVVTEPQDLQRVFNSIADYPGAKTLSFLRGVSNSRTFGMYAKNAIGKIRQIEKEVTILEAGQLLGVDSHTARADGAVFDVEGKAIDYWTDPSAWFVWHFKLEESGVYKLEVLQALADDEESQFDFFIGVARLQGRAVDTGSWEDYQPKSLNTRVKLEAGKTYALFLRAGEVVPARMMSFKGLRLQKQ